MEPTRSIIPVLVHKEGDCQRMELEVIEEHHLLLTFSRGRYKVTVELKEDEAPKGAPSSEPQSL